MKTTKGHVILKDFSALSFDNIEMKAADSSETPISRIRRASSFDSKKPKPARVLVVDDERNIRESLAKVLRAEGYDVRLAENGQEALAVYDPEETDLVLMDLNMPVKSGWDTLDRMVAVNPRQAIIIITGKSPQLNWATMTGTGTLIEKPIDMPELLNCMKRVLAEPASEREKRVEIQRSLTRFTRPLPCSIIGGAGHRRGGLNE